MSSNGVAYTYDALDNRVGKSGGVSLQYFHFGGSLVATRDGSGAWTDTLYGPHGILGTVAGAAAAVPVYRMGDHLDSSPRTTDGDGNVVGGASVLPFGQTMTNSTGGRFLFAGLEYDGENGSSAATFRQYAARLELPRRQPFAILNTMQVTVTIPDELAAQAQAQGLSPERYIEQWAASQVAAGEQTDRQQKLAQLESFFTEMAANSDGIPLLPEQAFTRESFYRDHD